MCELLGLNFKLPVSPSFSFRGFRHRSEGNPHGWGIARYEGKACQILKEAIDAQESKLAEFVRDYDLFQSQIFIGHVRDATRGNHTLQNTHPFKRVFRSREVILAHNGTMDSLPLDKMEMKYIPVGETDSEHIFCALLATLAADETQFTDYKKIERVLTEFNKLGKMNLLFSEGEHLYIYRDKEGHNGLCLTERISPFGVRSVKGRGLGDRSGSRKEPRPEGFCDRISPPNE